jgi:anti-sigma factor RsiW
MSTKLSPDKLWELLLDVPWYVNGTLAPEERTALEEAAKSNEALRRNIELAREDQASAFELSATSGAPGTYVLDRVLAATAATGRARMHDAKASLAARFASFVASLAPRTLAIAGAAAAVLLVVQATTIGWMALDRGGGQSIELASGGQERGDMAFVIAVRFAENAKLADIVALFETRGLVIVDGPVAGNLFVVGLQKTDGEMPTSEETVAYLVAAPNVVSFAATLTSEEN